MESPETVQKAIKPLDLDRNEPSDIYRHGDNWIAVVQRLKHIQRMPEQLVFTVRTPGADEVKKKRAADEIRSGLCDAGAVVVPFDPKEIRTVAAIPDGARDLA